ncbi:programmed cell death 1 ligand 1-like [Hemibagrus wyckioides]|uniref:programmed cell death 1 ligand 1-like n=1 Tax=Hemibagrus wyckioides TaxID=337641 RepID=UPI00266D3F9D|nr:programmed cell death 1 ligand 1-like [Hemibagrus wyckioides]
MSLAIGCRLCFFPLGFVLLVNGASVQDVHVVHAVAGENVTLPCSVGQIKQNKFSVYWRFNDSTTVCDIIRGKVDFDEQHPVYRGKVKYLPREQVKGDFSIQLLNVNSAHHGIYTCNIPNIATEIVQLTIEERRPSLRPRQKKLISHNGDSRGHPHIFMLFSAALLGLFLPVTF